MGRAIAVKYRRRKTAVVIDLHEINVPTYLFTITIANFRINVGAFLRQRIYELRKLFTMPFNFVFFEKGSRVP